MYGQGMVFSNWLCGGGFIPGPFGMILTVLFWALVVGLVVKVFQYLVSSKVTGKPSGAFGILNNRYAKGEISKVELE